MNTVVILALIASLQKEVVLLETELAQQQAVVAVQTAPITESMPLGSAPLQPTPTSTPSGTPIVYVGEQDTQPVPESCSITASVSPQNEIGSQSNPNAVTMVNWTLSGIPTSTQGILVPIDPSQGNFIVHVAPDQESGATQDSVGYYFPAGIKATFGSSTCMTYFPDEYYLYVPTTTIYSSDIP